MKSRLRMSDTEQTAPTRARTPLTIKRSCSVPAKLEWMAYDNRGRVPGATTWNTPAISPC